MSVRAKFRLDSVECSLVQQGHYEGQKYVSEGYKEMRTLNFAPVYSQDPESENHKFWKSSPSGSLKLGTINPEAWQAFELGKEYYLDFTPAI